MINQTLSADIAFTQDVSAAAFSLRTLGGTTNFNFYNNSVLVGTFLAATSGDLSTGRYYGYTGILFDEITMTFNPTNQSTPYFTIDNLQFNAQTPLPAALPLFATGLGVMGLLGWRRKRKDTAATAKDTAATAVV